MVALMADTDLGAIYGKLDFIAKSLSEISSQQATLAERLDNHKKYSTERLDKLEVRLDKAQSDISVVKDDHSETRSELKTRVKQGLTLAAVIGFVVTIYAQVWPHIRNERADAPAYATEKRQNQYPPQRLPPQEGK